MPLTTVDVRETRALLKELSATVLSRAEVGKLVNSGFNEGLLSERYLPDNKFALVQAVSPIPTGTGLLDKPCGRMPIFIFTAVKPSST